MGSILIKGGRVLDPASGRDEQADVAGDGTLAIRLRARVGADLQID